MSEDFFDEIRDLAAAAAEATFNRWRRERPRESFYGYGLMTPDCVGYSPVGASAESLALHVCRGYLEHGWTVLGRGQSREGLKADKVVEYDDLRHCPSEWWNPGVSPPDSELWSRLWESCNTLADAASREDDPNQSRRSLVLDRLHEAMLAAMKSLDAKAFFGAGEARERICLWVWVDPWLSAEWSRRAIEELNPPAVVRRIMAEAPSLFAD